MRLRRSLAFSFAAAVLGAAFIAGTPGVHADGPGSAPSHPVTVCCRPTAATSTDSPAAAIDTRHDQLVAAWDGNDYLGNPLGTAQPLAGGAGWSRGYEHGVIYALWGNLQPLVSTTGPGGSRPTALALWEVHGQVYDKYVSAGIGGPDGFLGYPQSDVQLTPYGKLSYFEYGAIYWSGYTGAHEVHGDIFSEYQSTAIAETTGPLGWPVSDEQAGPAGGRLSRFEHGTIYWTGHTGAHALYGQIEDRYNQPGVQAQLGYPTSDITGGETNPAVWQRTRFEHGWIYAATFADGTRPTFIIQDGTPVAQRWAADGGEARDGAPISDEGDASAGGRFQRFTASAIYWSPAHGAHPIIADIYQFWAGQHYESGPLGYPIADQIALADAAGSCQQFEHGWVFEAHTQDSHGAWHFATPRIVTNVPCAPAPVSAGGMTMGGPHMMPSTDSRTTFDFILTGDWANIIYYPDASQMYVVACPATADISTCRHYSLTRGYDGNWRGSAPHGDGAAGTWQFAFHVGGILLDGGVAGDDDAHPGIFSPLWLKPWTAGGAAVTASFDDTSSSFSTGSGDLQWSLILP